MSTRSLVLSALYCQHVAIPVSRHRYLVSRSGIVEGSVKDLAYAHNICMHNHAHIFITHACVYPAVVCARPANLLALFRKTVRRPANRFVLAPTCRQWAEARANVTCSKATAAEDKTLFWVWQKRKCNGRAIRPVHQSEATAKQKINGTTVQAPGYIRGANREPRYVHIHTMRCIYLVYTAFVYIYIWFYRYTCIFIYICGLHV